MMSQGLVLSKALPLSSWLSAPDARRLLALF